MTLGSGVVGMLIMCIPLGVLGLIMGGLLGAVVGFRLELDEYFIRKRQW